MLAILAGHLGAPLSEAHGLEGRSRTFGRYAQARRRLCANGDDETCPSIVETL